MYYVTTIPIIVQLTQELDSLCGQRPLYALMIFYFCLKSVFRSVDNQIFINKLMCVYMCYRPPVHEVCPNYEVVEFQPWKVTPPEPRIYCLLLRIYTCPALPSLPPP